MTLPRPNILKLIVPALVFLTGLTVFGLLNRSSTPATSSSADSGGLTTGLSTDERIVALRQAIERDRSDPRGYGLLGAAYLQKVREGGPPALYVKAQEAFGAALRHDPRDVAATVGLGNVALARHHFGEGLRHGLAAQRLGPELVAPYPVIVDAQIELGRYDEAARSLQRMVDLKPNLASYSRVSYFRELHGDLDGAIRAMRLAVAAGGDAPENVAYVQTLLGNLELERGNRREAGAAFRLALDRLPEYPAALAGLAQFHSARGELATSARLYRRAIEEGATFAYIQALGEVELGRGRRAAARRAFADVRAEFEALRKADENTGTERALFEASHGDRPLALRLAREGYAAGPSVRSADALGWALTRVGRAREGLRWAHRALRLGTRTPSFLFHAGIAAKAAGRPAEARRHLLRSLELNPGFSPVYAPQARRALRAL